MTLSPSIPLYLEPTPHTFPPCASVDRTNVVSRVLDCDPRESIGCAESKYGVTVNVTISLAPDDDMQVTDVVLRISKLDPEVGLHATLFAVGHLTLVDRLYVATP
jgi:hypothetical protein